MNSELVEAISAVLRYHETGGHEGDGSDEALAKARDALHRLASQPPVSDDLVEAVATALCEADGADWYAHSFTTTPNGQTPEEMRSGYRDIARAIIPIVREECAKAAWQWLIEKNFSPSYADAVATAIRERSGGHG